MAPWIDVIDKAHFPTDSYYVFDWNDLSILILYKEETFYAIENRCSHEDQPLDEGSLEGDEIICPLHGAGFCIKTGAVTRPPAYEAIKTFPVRLNNGKIQVELEDDE